MEDKQEQSGLGMIAPMVGPVAAGLYGLFGPSRDTLRREQLEDQQKFTDMQADANKGQAKYTSDLQYEMWNKTNYEAQMEHIKAAGLNPALLYGKGGAGGATTGSASAAGVSGGQASSSAAVKANEIAMGTQIAQLGLITAQAEKTKAETEKIKGADTDLARTQTEKIGSEITMQNLQNMVAGETLQSAIRTIDMTADKAVADAVRSQQQQVITEETMNEQISKIKTESIGAIIANEVQRSNIKINEERIKEIAASIEQRWKEQDISVENNKRMTEAMLWGAGIHAAGDLVGGIVNIAGKGVPNVIKHIK